MTYNGLPGKLKEAVFDRDQRRCRWCGQQRSWLGFDAHHIEYRRGSSYDRIENLITLCRTCHDFVHNSYRIPKITAQEILTDLVASPAVTGWAMTRRIKAIEEPSTKELSGQAENGVGRILDI